MSDTPSEPVAGSEAHGEHQPVFEYLQLWDQLLRRLFYRFRRSDRITEALDRLSKEHKETKRFHLAREARIRWEAYRIVLDYVERRPGRSGAGGAELLQLRRHLWFLGEVLFDDLELAEHLQANLALDEIEFAPDQPGGAKRIRKGPGRRPSVFTEAVRELLRRRFPEWDGDPPFPGHDTEELREWVADQLRSIGHPRSPGDPGFRSALSWDASTEGSLFEPEDIDPKAGGPISRVIENLRRMQ